MAVKTITVEVQPHKMNSTITKYQKKGWHFSGPNYTNDKKIELTFVKKE